MDLQIPDWLDEKFLTTILKDEESKDVDVEVVKFSAGPAMAPGNNYLSYIYSVRVEYKTSGVGSDKTVTDGQGLALMVKVPMDEGLVKEVAEKHNFYDKEPKIYSELLPNLNKVTFCDFGPKSYNCPVKNVLVMEDLKEEDYFVSDKTRQLDFFHSKAVLKKLAKFHAASVIFLNNKELIGEVGIDHYFDTLESFTKHSVKHMLKRITGDEKHKRLATFIRDRYEQIWPSHIQLTKPKPDGGFNVLNHGDLWTNNIMFKYDSSGEVVDVKFIDFQLLRLGSPVNDLVTFIWTSANEEVRGKRQKELFSIYLGTVNKTLAALGSDQRLSEQELKEDLSRSVDFAIGLLSFNVAVVIAGPEDVPDFQNLTEEDFETDKFLKVFKGNTYSRLFPNYLNHITEFFLDGKGMLGNNS